MSRVFRLFALSLLLALSFATAGAAAGAPLTPASEVLPPTAPPAPTGGDPRPEPPGATASSSSARPLVGTFKITAGSCGAGVTGSYFRMVQPGGTAAGPFVSNSDSPCADKTYTPLRPGSDGGLVTRAFQAQPSSPFDSAGNGRSARITAPQRFYGVDFATATNQTDPQTGVGVSAPEVLADGSSLTGDLRAFAASWNNQHFNQGAPKPDGTTPGTTKRPSGTLDSSTGAFRLEWTSLIVGGPFNNFTGLWHLEGNFVSRESAAGGGTTTGGSAGSSVAGSAAGGTGSAATRSGRAGGLASTGAGAESAIGAVFLVAGLLLRRLRGGVTSPEHAVARSGGDAGATDG